MLCSDEFLAHLWEYWRINLCKRLESVNLISLSRILYKLISFIALPAVKSGSFLNMLYNILDKPTRRRCSCWWLNRLRRTKVEVIIRWFQGDMWTDIFVVKSRSLFDFSSKLYFLRLRFIDATNDWLNLSHWLSWSWSVYLLALMHL